MSVSAYAAWVIAGMTLITFFGFRLGGYLAGGLLPTSGRLSHVMDRLPAFVLVAVVAPEVYRLGWVGALAAGLVLLLTWRTGRALVAMGLGVVIVALARSLDLLAVP